MKKAIVAVGVVAVAALVMVLFLPALMPQGMAADLGVTFYDKDGNEVGSLTFVRAGQEVTAITVTMSYVVTSTSERFEENLDVTGNVLIEWAIANPSGAYQTAYEHSVMESRTASQNYAWDHNLRDIIAVDEDGKYYGWTVRITATLEAQTTMQEGEIVSSDPWTETVQFTIEWYTDSLVVTGTVGG